MSDSDTPNEEKPLEKGDAVSYMDGTRKVEGVISEVRKGNGDHGWAMVQSEDDLQSIPLRDLVREPNENA